MQAIDVPVYDNKKDLYEALQLHLGGVIQSELEWLPNLANVSALLWQYLPEINWSGFYVVCGEYLLLGPFQGKPACVTILKGNGVCGTAWKTDQVQLIPNVHDFPGHIACDGASNSEIVLPIHFNGQVVAVLDIDSPILERFDTEDQRGLEGVVSLLEEHIDWSRVQAAYDPELNKTRSLQCNIGF